MRPKHGFTLIELTVGLMIASIVVLIAAAVFAAVADRSRTLVSARQTLDHDGNARRWLQASFLSLEVGERQDSTFEGHSGNLSFSAWRLTSDGWFEPGFIRLERDEEHHQLIAIQSRESPIVLADSVVAATFDYLMQPGLKSLWMEQWVSRVSAPVAVRLRIQRALAGDKAVVDTLLFLIKERG